MKPYRERRPPEEAYWPTEKTDADLGREEPEQIHPPLEDAGFRPPWWRQEDNPRFGAVDPLVLRQRFHVLECRFGKRYQFVVGCGVLEEAKNAAIEHMQEFGRYSHFIKICVWDRLENLAYMRRTLSEEWHVIRKLSMRNPTRS